MDKTRHYGMDWLRIGAFALLILYHIGMFFVPWGWHVKTPQPMDWVQIPMMATNSWRLPLLFLVSGYASAALFAKLGTPGAFLRSRAARLLIPLVVGMIVVIPVQPWIELVTQHGYAGSFSISGPATISASGRSTGSCCRRGSICGSSSICLFIRCSRCCCSY